MRTWISLILVSATCLTKAQGSFDRDKVMAFWADGSRYMVTPPDDFREKGLWQVRLTVSGSSWIWNYNKARQVNAPPTENAKPVNDEQKEWDRWVEAKVARDRWIAWKTARAANLAAIGIEVPTADKTIPASEPPEPGPIPSGLLTLAGDPPTFAEAVVPMKHSIRFDDVTLDYRDNTRVSNPRYAYYRFGQGVASEGVSVKSMPASALDRLFGKAGCSPSEAKVMRTVSSLEGGFDSINTYDTGFVSVGFIQFASLKEGKGSLGEMLRLYKRDRPEAFADDFVKYGIDVTPEGFLDILDPSTGAELVGPDANSRIIDDKRLIAVFQRAGLKSEEFQAAQIRAAKAMFYPADDALSLTLGGNTVNVKVCDLVHSEAGMATLMDRKVNTGNIRLLTDVVNWVAQERNAATPEDLGKFERDIVAAMKYRRDYLTDSTLSQPVPTTGSIRPFEQASRGGGTRGKRTGGGRGPKTPGR